MCTSSASALRRGGSGQLLDREIDLIGDQEVQAEQVMRRFPRAAPIEPLAVPQLVTLPRLADRQTGKQGDQRNERGVLGHDFDARRFVRPDLAPGAATGPPPVYAPSSASHRP